MQSYILVCVLACLLAFGLLSLVDRIGSNNSVCVLHITGESVRLYNCALSPDLIDSVSKLQPLKLDTLSLQ
uniref:Movement protein TGBp3 n=1 Tax=Butterbur mosaic virus TaxID=666859 RepID=A0A7U0RB08_9VIRU|nr:TGB3 [Butterbur mosaic virus]